MLHIHDHGEGSALVLLHGAPSPASDLVSLAKPFLSQRRVLVPDLPGYGKSSALADYSLEAVQELLENELLSRGIEEMDLVGFSLGGYRAMCLALNSRIRVNRLVTVGAQAHFTEEHAAAFIGFAEMLEQMPDFSSPDVRGMVAARFVSPDHLARHPEDAERIGAWLDVTTPAVMAVEMRAAAASPDLREGLAKLDIPVTAIVGEADLAVPAPYSQEIASLCPRGEYVMLPGAGHAVNIEKLQATQDAVARGLALKQD